MKFAIFLKISLVSIVFFYLQTKIDALIISITRTAMNAKIPMFAICVETIIYFLLNDLHDCTFNGYLYTVYLVVNYIKKVQINKKVWNLEVFQRISGWQAWF